MVRWNCGNKRKRAQWIAHQPLFFKIGKKDKNNFLSPKQQKEGIILHPLHFTKSNRISLILQVISKRYDVYVLLLRLSHNKIIKWEKHHRRRESTSNSISKIYIRNHVLSILDSLLAVAQRRVHQIVRQDGEWNSRYLWGLSQLLRNACE